MKTNGKLIIALARSYKAIHSDSDAMLKSYGLTNGQFAVMEALYSKGELTVSELIEKVLTTSGNMTVLISNLEKAGYISRRKHDEDKRCFLISLTLKGEKIMNEVFPQHMESIGEKLSVLTEEEKQNVINILKKLNREDIMEFFEALKVRRSQYSLAKSSKISDEEILDIVREGVKHAPSAFNSQTTRAFVLFGENHDKLWDIVKDALINKIGEERYANKTAEKIAGFKSAYGTVLFYINKAEVKEMAEKYTDLFDSWSYQSAGMVIGNVWVGLSQAGLGANLQHYNPLIDEKVKEVFNIPDGFELIGQMDFGDIVAPPKEKEFKDIDELVKVYK